MLLRINPEYTPNPTQKTDHESIVDFSLLNHFKELAGKNERKQWVALFKTAAEAANNWKKDRPLIASVDTGINTTKLLVDEVGELNGGDKMGVFSEEEIAKDPATKADYRQQEISDIIFFSMSLHDVLGKEINIEGLYDRLLELSAELDVEVVSSDVIMSRPDGRSESKEETYQVLKERLNVEATAITTLMENVKNEADIDVNSLLEKVENAVVYAMAMQSILGVNSPRAVLEKVAKNALKYPAHQFQLPEGKFSPEELMNVYLERRKVSNNEFEGVVDPTTGERPKKGTTDLYSPQPVVIYDRSSWKNYSEIGPIYQSLAWIVAQSIGLKMRTDQSEQA